MLIWRQLPRDVGNIDVKLQKSLGQMSICLVPIIKSLDYLQSTKTSNKPSDRGRCHDVNSGNSQQQQSQARKNKGRCDAKIKEHDGNCHSPRDAPAGRQN